MAKVDDKLLERVKKDLQRQLERESDARDLWKKDLKFANADPDNGWQWPDDMRKSREADKRPCLTINKTKQHNRQITNDARQNKPSVRVVPVDSGADRKTAEILNGIIRHIEANSSADTAYDTAAEHAVDAGLGYWRVITDYASDDSFDQEIFIRRVKNPLTIVLGPHNEADGSDAKQAWVFEDLEKADFERQYPDADAISWSEAGIDDWRTKDTIRVCEYYEITEERDTLIADETGNTMLLSKMEPEMAAAVKGRDDLKKRTVFSPKLKWWKLAGDGQELDKRDLLGKYIPIVKVVGDEIEIDGKIERKGHTRGMKDAQRMYNYNSSAAVEYGALQTKVPIIAPAEAIEGFEEYWNTANTANHAYLPYNSFNENGDAINMPQRMTAPAPAQLFLQGMATASEEMKMASGQFDASMGAKSNETSGRAIMARQREGDTATFHFIDNVARAIKYTGKILVDLIPKIYDTERVVRILGEDGKEDKARINPQQSQAYVKQQNPTTREIEEIYNPSVGRYDVTVSVGPSYNSKRQEAFQALTEMSSRNPQLMQVAGDLIMKAADFPMADQLAERLEKTLPPNLQEQDENQELPPQAKAHIEQLTQQNQAMDQAIQKMDAELETKNIEAGKIALENRKLDLEFKKIAMEEAVNSAENGVSIGEIMQRFDVITQRFDSVESILIDQMRHTGQVTDDHLQPDPPPEQMQPEQPAPAGFFSPNDSQQ